MGIIIKPKFKYSVTVIFLSVITLLSGAYGISLSHLGFLSLPITAAFLAAVFVFENKKRIASYVLPSVLIIIEILSCFFGDISLSAIFSIITALIVAVWFLKGHKKSDAVLIITALIAVLLIVTLVLTLCLDNLITSHADISTWIRAEINNFNQSATTQLSAKAGASEMQNDMLTEEYLSEIFHLLYQTIPAWGIIFAFALCGITFKIFSHLVIKYSEDEVKIMSWRFMASPIYAYFYVSLLLVSLFIGNTDDLFSITVLNLQLIFMAVFAYIGYTFTSALVAIRSNKPLNSLIWFTVLLILLSSFALRILAIVGAVITILHGRIVNKNQG